MSKPRKNATAEPPDLRAKQWQACGWKRKDFLDRSGLPPRQTRAYKRFVREAGQMALGLCTSAIAEAARSGRQPIDLAGCQKLQRATLDMLAALEKGQAPDKSWWDLVGQEPWRTMKKRAG